MSRSPIEIEFVHPQDSRLPLVRDGERLVCRANGDWFPLRGGIARLGGAVEKDQQQTRDGFAYKWQRTTDFGSTVAPMPAATSDKIIATLEHSQIIFGVRPLCRNSLMTCLCIPIV